MDGPADNAATAQEPPRLPVAVQVRGLVKSFGMGETTVTVLKGIDLDVHFGELLLVVGESGGGKTSLLSAIAGILDIDAGELEVLGASLTNMTVGTRTSFRGQRMGFVFQQFNLLARIDGSGKRRHPALDSGPAETRGHFEGAADAGTRGARRSHRISAPESFRRTTTTRCRRARIGQRSAAPSSATNRLPRSTDPTDRRSWS